MEEIGWLLPPVESCSSAPIEFPLSLEDLGRGTWRVKKIKVFNNKRATKQYDEDKPAKDGSLIIDLAPDSTLDFPSSSA